MVGLGTGKTECPMGPWVMLIIPWSINKWIDRGGEHYFVSRGVIPVGDGVWVHTSVCVHTQDPGT